MKKASLLILLFSHLVPISLFSLHSEKMLSPSGLTVELVYRALQPGEAIVVAIEERSGVQDAQIHFLGEKYRMRDSEISSKLLAFIGLDLALEPGIYPMKIFITKKDGEREVVQKDVSVLAKEFPVKKLWVKEEYVTPPPKVQERIRREADILKIVYGMKIPRWLGEGKFILPSSGEAVENFGERRIYNYKPRSPHGGVDISDPYGTLVRASNSGRVVLASDLYFAGKTVIIDHGLGVFTLYCHFSEIRIKRGEFVRKGDIIGEVGATGRVTGPHLHWGVKISGNRVDPFSLLNLDFE